jgi:hypothetical protein
MLTMAVGVFNPAPRVAQPRDHGVSSMAFMGLPCPTKSTGILDFCWDSWAAMGITCSEGFEGAAASRDDDDTFAGDDGLEQPTTPNAARDCTRRRRESDTEV